MTEYRRTAIRSVRIRRYRSIQELDLDDLPPIVVLHGHNGAGKSNVLRAIRLVLRAASLPGDLPISRDGALSLSLAEADAQLDFRPDDFRFGDQPDVRIALEVSLGRRALDLLQPPGDIRVSRLSLDIVLQKDREGRIRFWLDRAEVDGGLDLREPPDEGQSRIRTQLGQFLNSKGQLEANRAAQEAKLASLTHQLSSQSSQPQQQAQTEAQLAKFRANIQAQTDQLAAAQRQIDDARSKLGERIFLKERVRSTLIPKLLQVSEAYRVPRGPHDPEGALYQAFLSEDPHEREAAKRLSQRLARAHLFGSGTGPVSLLPVNSATYGEQQVRVTHPSQGDLPLRNLGSGEQQIVIMLAQRIITPFPIAHVEEPEAHLHRAMMEPFAKLLRDTVLGNGAAPDVDQLWIATHHRYFSLTNEFFDVSLDEEGLTRVVRRPRDEAAVHFYEPSPYLDTLRQLVESGMNAGDIVYRDEDLGPVSAGDVLASIEGDQELALRFVESATRAFVLSLRQEDPEK